jgi:hypothetical protein
MNEIGLQNDAKWTNNNHQLGPREWNTSCLVPWAPKKSEDAPYCLLQQSKSCKTKPTLPANTCLFPRLVQTCLNKNRGKPIFGNPKLKWHVCLVHEALVFPNFDRSPCKIMAPLVISRPAFGATWGPWGPAPPRPPVPPGPPGAGTAGTVRGRYFTAGCGAPEAWVAGKLADGDEKHKKMIWPTEIGI